MTTDRTYFVDIFQDIIDHIVSIYDPVITVGEETTGGEKPYAFYGTFEELVTVLSEKDDHSVLKFKKYPLIVLIQDLDENKGKELAHEYLVNPRIIILTETKQNYKSNERMPATFKPILNPIYNLLMEEIADNPNILQHMPDIIQHTKTNRLNWGTHKQAESLIDFLDGIDINIKDLRIYKAKAVEEIIYVH